MRGNASVVLAGLALFVALSGASYAALALPKNSVTTKQVKDHSLLKKDFRAGQVPRGPAGEPGPPGPVNTTALTRVDGPQVGVGPLGCGGCEVQTSTAMCPAGQRAVTGGIDTFTGGLAALYSAATSDRAGWTVIVANGSSYGSGYVKALAYCGGSGQAVVAARSRLSDRDRRQIARREADFRARAAAAHP